MENKTERLLDSVNNVADKLYKGQISQITPVQWLIVMASVIVFLSIVGLILSLGSVLVFVLLDLVVTILWPAVIILLIWMVILRIRR
ncbi:MAG: hypothetical protein Q7S32_04415 [bacterium]|nr:hypothetical protein [bacterium]